MAHMLRKSLIAVAVLIPVLAAGPVGCANKKIRQADAIAQQGDWETALTQYRLAAEERPTDKTIQERILKAEEHVAAIYVKRAGDANAAGRLGEAGDLWRRALELVKDESTQSKVKAEIAANAAALEYYGDISTEFYSWPDAIGAYGALLLVEPESVDLLERYRAAKREYASELSLAADDLAKRDLKAAALVANLRALQHDPMQQGAFDRVSSLRKELQASTRINLDDVKVTDNGYKALGAALAPKIAPRLDDYPPYGPTRDKNALQAELVVVIESFEKNETVEKGVETMPNSLPQPTEPVPNPAIDEQKKKIAELGKELKKMQADVRKLVAAAKKTKRPTPSTRKKVAAETEKRRLEGLELARKIDAKRAEIESEKRFLASLPATVPPPPLPATWELPWAEHTRTVTAKVRFELREKDFDRPLSVVLTRTVTHKDRQHGGNEEQGAMADKLELPTWEAMCAEIAEQYVQEGPSVIAQARERRVARMLAEGRNKEKMGSEEEALNAYVRTLFMVGAEELPEDAAVLVAKEAENEKLKEILGVK